MQTIPRPPSPFSTDEKVLLYLDTYDPIYKLDGQGRVVNVKLAAARSFPAAVMAEIGKLTHACSRDLIYLDAHLRMKSLAHLKGLAKPSQWPGHRQYHLSRGSKASNTSRSSKACVIRGCPKEIFPRSRGKTEKAIPGVTVYFALNGELLSEPPRLHSRWEWEASSSGTATVSGLRPKNRASISSFCNSSLTSSSSTRRSSLSRLASRTL